MTHHRRHLAAATVGALLALTGAANAGPTAVELIFGTPFLAQLPAGATLSYHFTRTADDKGLSPSFEDDVKLSVEQSGEERSASVDLYTGPRAKTVGPLPNMNGNPLVMVMLEQDVREMGKVLGGNPYYIRNRIREAINEGEQVQSTKINYAGRMLEGWTITLKPFAKDQNRDKLKDFAERSYEITIADGVPGGLYRIRTVTPRNGAPDKPLLVEELKLSAIDAGAGTEAKP